MTHWVALASLALPSLQCPTAQTFWHELLFCITAAGPSWAWRRHVGPGAAKSMKRRHQVEWDQYGQKKKQMGTVEVVSNHLCKSEPSPFQEKMLQSHWLWDSLLQGFVVWCSTCKQPSLFGQTLRLLYPPPGRAFAGADTLAEGLATAAQMEGLAGCGAVFATLWAQSSQRGGRAKRWVTNITAPKLNT